jgi:hypothetical protein
MKKALWLLMLLLMPALFGCSHTSKTKPWTPQTVSEPPPAPDTKPVEVEVKAGQSDLQEVIKVAKATPAAAPIVSKLESADGHLTNALLKNETLTQQVKATVEDDRQAREVLNGNIKQAGETIDALTKERDELKDEAMRNARNRLMWMGILLIIGGAGSVAAFFFLGFTAGPKLAPILVMSGAFLITLSQVLQKIVFYTEVGFGIGALVLVIWIMWHLFHHVPEGARNVPSQEKPT